MEQEFRAILVAHAPLTALVGQRIVWNHLPQKTTRPAVVLYRVAGGPGLTMQGSDGLIGATVQIDVQALSVTSMWAVRDALVARLHGHRDTTFRGIFQQSERQTSEELTGGGLVHRASLDFAVWATA